MPMGRYPDRVKEFNKWSRDKVNASRLSDSATGSGRTGYRKRRTRRRRKKKED